MNRIQELQTVGQSIWLDYIERGMVHSGELAGLVDEGLTGVTSNPTIFQQAIAKSSAYRTDLEELVATETDSRVIFEKIGRAHV